MPVVTTLHDNNSNCEIKTNGNLLYISKRFKSKVQQKLHWETVLYVLLRFYQKQEGTISRETLRTRRIKNAFSFNSRVMLKNN